MQHGNRASDFKMFDVFTSKCDTGGIINTVKSHKTKLNLPVNGLSVLFLKPYTAGIVTQSAGFLTQITFTK